VLRRIPEEMAFAFTAKCRGSKCFVVVLKVFFACVTHCVWAPDTVCLALSCVFSPASHEALHICVNAFADDAVGMCRQKFNVLQGSLKL